MRGNHVVVRAVRFKIIGGLELRWMRPQVRDAEICDEFPFAAFDVDLRDAMIGAIGDQVGVDQAIGREAADSEAQGEQPEINRARGPR